MARRSLREQVSFFEEQSLNGEYYEDFNVNSNNFMVSEGTQRWIRECLRLFDRLVAASARGHHNVTREGCEVLFALLRPLDQGDDGVIFFADEAGSWQVGVPWEDVLPAYFGSLAATVAPAVFGRSVLGVVDDFGKQERARYLRAARRVATAEQKRTLRPG